MRTHIPVMNAAKNLRYIHMDIERSVYTPILKTAFRLSRPTEEKEGKNVNEIFAVKPSSVYFPFDSNTKQQKTPSWKTLNINMVRFSPHIHMYKEEVVKEGVTFLMDKKTCSKRNNVQQINVEA
ncbi:hypothetical protein AKO1_010656 [Acrasis kona]|uniref:Nbr1 n=1 Tax=Acrasis kona TaxID=1008807 RepID=A0AAW2YLW5_9EUKA